VALSRRPSGVSNSTGAPPSIPLHGIHPNARWGSSEREPTHGTSDTKGSALATSHELRPRRGRTPAKPRGAKAALWIAVLVVLGVVLFFPVALATDRSTFCRACHEMIPYYDAWLVGQHAKTAQCIDCHVDAGLPARFAHKFVALGEVKSHVLGDTSFPQETPADVPNRRCTRCHKTLPKTAVDGFSHEIHAKKGTCATCHASTGHNVTVEVLKAVGIYSAAASPARNSSAFAVVDRGTANVEGHKKIGCSRCHDMAKTGCPRCHTLNAAKHPWKGDCAQCHQPGEKFTFTHPSSTDCQACHKPGEKHFRPVSGQLPPCKTCHPATDRSWKFSHPESGAECATCHKPPANHYPGECPQCHQRAGDTWAFSHPGVAADCASCHKPPANHYPGQCSACHHRQGVSWKFSHPSSGEHSWKSRACKTCHPKSYTAAYCTCHGGNPPGD
jgi:hypothetical protein